MDPPPPSARRRMTDAFILIFLAIQLLLPVRWLVADPIDTRGNFSWNMYSRRYSCRIEYTFVAADGTRLPIDYRSYFHRPKRSMMALRRDILPRFHAYLCEHARPAPGEIHATVACVANRDPRRDLVVPGVDICTADNYGVTRD